MLVLSSQKLIAIWIFAKEISFFYLFTTYVCIPKQYII